MSTLKTPGYPVVRTAVRWVADVLLTLLAGAAALPGLFHGNGKPAPAAVAAVLLIASLVLVRRIWPVAVFGGILTATIGAGLWDRRAIDGLALLIALYTVAAMRPRRDALVSAAVLEVATVIAVIVVAGGSWWYDAIFLSGMNAAALGLGLYVATRRAYLAELHDRAERLERERHQQYALAAAAERARIAREMHDIVAHHLTVMVTLSEAAVAASAASPERATDVMRTVSATGRRALADTRRLLGVLREQPGDDTAQAREPVPDLAQLDGLIEQVRAAGLATTLEVHGSVPDVPPGVQLTVYRLVQEALTNTLKHGGAGARARVRLRYLPGELLVDVDDDGAGSAAPAPASAGAGLAGMRERVRAYGGSVSAGPGPADGWTVSARLNLDGADIT